MHLGLRLLMLAIIAILFVFFINMLGKQKLDLKYCLIWMFGMLGLAAFCIFPQLLISLSAVLGIETPVNTLFLICIAFLTCINISLTVVASRLSDRLRKLTQNIAIKQCESNGKQELI